MVRCHKLSQRQEVADAPRLLAKTGCPDLILRGMLMHDVPRNGQPEAALQSRFVFRSVGCGTCQGHVKAEGKYHSILHGPAQTSGMPCYASSPQLATKRSSTV